MDKQLFALGRIIATPGALEAMSAAETNGFEYLARHVQGDWGDLGQEDKRENDLSVREGFRILSAYMLRTEVKIWIITEADRSATTFVLGYEASEGHHRSMTPLQQRPIRAPSRGHWSLARSNGRAART